MSINRREMLMGLGLGTFAVACPSKTRVVHLPCDLDAFVAAKLPPVPDSLTKQMVDAVEFMRANGWLDLVGWKDAPPNPLDQAYLDPRRLPATGLGDFAGRLGSNGDSARAIHPGRPELSLLYHVLASRTVMLTAASEVAYPTLALLDTVENFIYALHDPPAKDENGGAITYVAAVLAYEYRPAAQTPHARHADLVFSRTGIARVGQHPLNYRNQTREFSNLPAKDESLLIDDPKRGKELAVTGARYALFLTRQVDSTAITLMTSERGDGGKHRRFLLPERKLFSGDLLLDGAAITFSQRHVNERLQRLAQYRTKEGKALEIRPSSFARPPFRRESTSTDREPMPTAVEALVGLERHGSSVVVTPVPGALVRPAQVDANVRAALKVPATPHSRKDGVTRQYTTLELDFSDGPRAEFWEGLALLRRAGFIELRRPNAAPMLINVRYDVDGTDPTMPITDPTRIEKGGYWAALFEDSICDGAIAAMIQPRLVRPRYGALGGTPWPAYSIVGAPDFFPAATGLELDEDDPELADNFLKGGTIPLATVRIAPNRHLRHPNTTTNEPAFANGKADQTATAVLAAHSERDARSAVTEDKHRRSGYLPDSASGVFYPGWDITYDEADDGERFLTTYGLGSPFVEDVKLCAAANGMWPAESPDSARTYQGSLVGNTAPIIGGYYYSRTATPLTDRELGYHPASPGARKLGLQDVSGWDGEYGPFLDVSRKNVVVNYADINQVDQVRNALENRMDASQLRKLTTMELVHRMQALRRVIAAADGNEVYQTPYWLVSFEVVDWTDGTIAAAMPPSLATLQPWGQARENIVGAGYLLVLALPIENDPPVPAQAKRMTRRCQRLLVAQTCPTRIAWYAWDLAKSPQGAWSYR